MKVILPKSEVYRSDSRIGIQLPNAEFEIKFDLKAEIDPAFKRAEPKVQQRFVHVDLWATRYGFRKLLEFMMGHSAEGHYSINGLAKEILFEQEPDAMTEYKSDPTVESEEQ